MISNINGLETYSTTLLLLLFITFLNEGLYLAWLKQQGKVKDERLLLCIPMQAGNSGEYKIVTRMFFSLNSLDRAGNIVQKQDIKCNSHTIFNQCFQGVLE